MHGLISMFSVWTALLRVYEKNLVITRSLRKKKLYAVNSLSRSMCQDFRSEKSLLSFDSRKATTLRMIPLNLRILGGRLREVPPYYVLFLCWSYVRTPGHLKICWRADVHSTKHKQGESAAFAGFDRVEKRAIVSTFCSIINYFKFQSMSILAIRSNRRQETVSIPKYSLIWQNWTITFELRHFRVPPKFSLSKRG